MTHDFGFRVFATGLLIALVGIMLGFESMHRPRLERVSIAVLVTGVAISFAGLFILIWGHA